MITTCLNCPLKVVEGQTCEIFARATKAIRGSGVTSARIRCDKRKKLFRPGQYVTFMGVFRVDDNERVWREMDECFGWIWKFDVAKNKWLICGEDTDSPFVRIRPDRIILLDGNEKRCCKHCGKPEGVADQFKDRETGELRTYNCRWARDVHTNGYIDEYGLGCEFLEVSNG